MKGKIISQRSDFFSWINFGKLCSVVWFFVIHCTMCNLRLFCRWSAGVSKALTDIILSERYGIHFAVGFLTKIELKYHWMIFDFCKLKNSISCSCIFRKSITSHTKLCNSVRHFYYRLGRAATARRAQMSKIFGHGFDGNKKSHSFKISGSLNLWMGVFKSSSA